MADELVRLGLLAVLLAACSSTATSTLVTETSVVPSSLESTTTTEDTEVVSTPPEPIETGDIVGFELVDITLEGEVLLVALADTPDLRSQGLMGVEDMGDIDGMLFAWDELTTGAFWMKDTLIPLDIMFFDADGEQVSATTMTPCEADPCDRYPAEGAYRWALETPAGTLAHRSSLTLAP